MTLANMLLLASVVGLIVGPILLRLPSWTAGWQRCLDGFALVTVGGLAALHLIPEALGTGGLAAAGCALIGAILPVVMDKSAGRKGADASALLLLAGLIPHVALESAALGAADPHHVVSLGAAVAAHRLPVGLILFAILSRRYGDAKGWGAIVLVCLVTLGGFWAGESVAGSLTEQSFALLQAFVAGSLLHVAFAHRLDAQATPSVTAEPEVPESSCCHAAPPEPPPACHDATEAHTEDGEDHCHGGTSGIAGWSVLGAGLGVAVLALALLATPEHGHAAHDHGFGDTFLMLFLQSAPALLVAYLLAGLLVALVTPARAQWLGGRGQLSQALRGVGFGLPLPICSCGVLPLYETLVRRGVPATAAVAFLVATPELGIDALLLSVPLLGGELTMARLVAAFVVALVVALLVGRSIGASKVDVVNEEQAAVGPLGKRLWDGMRFGLVELFDSTMPWILVGLLVAAWLEPVLGASSVGDLPSIIQVPLFALLGIPLYVCASGATPIAAIAIFAGVSPGAGVAFLLAGPATNITTFGILTRLHGSRVAVLFGLSMTLGAIGAGLVVDGLGVQFTGEMADHAHMEGSMLQWACLAVISGLFAWSLLRQGPRGVVGHIRQPS